MSTQQKLEFRCDLPVSAEDAYAWHARPDAFARLQPPFMNTTIVRPPVVAEGATAEFKIHFGPLSHSWVARHENVDPPNQFVDVQVSGPFASWRHEHIFKETSPETCTLIDRIAYELPLGGLGALGAGFARGELERMFTHRHKVLLHDLTVHKRWSQKPQSVWMTGQSGLVGNALSALLRTGGHTVTPVKRGAHDDVSGSEPLLDVKSAWANDKSLDGHDAVVHLAGESIFGDRWSEAKKKRIMESRVRGTRAVVESILRAKVKPKVLVCASAVGRYNNNGADISDEDSPVGNGFLAEVVDAWEKELLPLQACSVRVVVPRIGVVLTALGGALEKQLPLFQSGLGGPVGSGKQWMAVIGLEDLCDVFLRAICDEDLSGPINAVLPESVRQVEFAKVLGRVLGRPAIIPTPGFAVKAALGSEQATELLLSGNAVRPGVLARLGHAYRAPTVEGTLRDTLGKPL